MKIEELENLYKNYVENKFQKFSALLIVIFIIGILFIFVHPFIGKDFDYEWTLFIIFIFITIIYWLVFKYYYPKNNKKQTGLIIALHAKKFEEVELKNKFIKELKKIINSSGFSDVFNIIELKNHLAEVNGLDDVEKFHKKIKGHLYLYGDIQKSRDGKDEKYFISLNGSVRHLPIPIPVSKNLSLDFRQLLPKEINFSSLFELRGCKFTAKLAYLTTRYIAGIAALLSRNPFLASKLHEGLDKEFNYYENLKKEAQEINAETELNIKCLRRIKDKLPSILSNEYLVISRYYFFIKKDNNSAKEYILKSIEYNQKNYASWLIKAIYDFSIDNNPDIALRSIQNAEKFSNGLNEWRYSKAFLLFWLGDFQEAYKECQKIVKNSYDRENITLEEVESFNQNLIKDNNDKPQLYFWLGFLKYKKTNHIPDAFSYLEKFVANSNSDFLKEKANSYLVDIKRQMQIK